MIKLNVLMSNITRISGNADSLSGDIQDALIGCASHLIMYGDVTPANALLEATSKTRIDRSAITAWLESFSPCYVKNDRMEHSSKRAKEHFPCTDDADVESYVAEMRKVRWTAFTKEKPAKSIFDPVSYLDGVIKKLTKEGVDVETIAIIRAAESKLVVERATLERLLELEAA